MADNETTADIIAEIRRRSDEAYKGSFNYPECQENQIEYDEASDWADRLEAAHKRERGNAAKLREALKLCLRGMCGYCRMDAEARGMTTECVNGCEVMLDAKAALAAPPRNCDVGTVEQQSERKIKFCHNQGGCFNCSFSKSPTLTLCALVWAQMPYEEAEGGSR